MYIRSPFDPSFQLTDALTILSTSSYKQLIDLDWLITVDVVLSLHYNSLQHSIASLSILLALATHCPALIPLPPTALSSPKTVVQS